MDDIAEILASTSETAASINDPETRTWVLTDVAAAFGNYGELEKARQLFALASAACEQINPKADRALAAHHLAVRQGEIFGGPEGLKAARRVNKQLRGYSKADVATSQARLGDVDGALRTIRQIRDRTHRATGLSQVVVVLAARDPSRAAEVLELLREVVASIRPETRQGEALSLAKEQLSRALAATGGTTEALRIFTTAWAGTESLTFESEEHRQAALRQRDEQAICLTEAAAHGADISDIQRCIELVESPIRQARARLMAGRALASRGEQEPARQLIREGLEASGDDPNNLRLAVSGHLALGERDVALQLVDRAEKVAPDPGFEPWNLWDLAVTLAAHNELETAFALCRRLKKADRIAGQLRVADTWLRQHQHVPPARKRR